ncbi:MAG TPA: hypothetical protein DCS42_12255 [Nitrospiraceae bacterium]|nr:hypothetical protein [Nitrospiraceae bacterium]
MDGRQITEAIIMPQTDVQDGIYVDPGGVFLHEFGHWLGLPDLYCTSLICFTDGAGDWSLMASGNYNADPALCPDAFGKCIYGSAPAHLDAWSKIYMGWVAPLTPATTSDPGSMSLDVVEKNRSIIKLQASTDTTAQYFLLENRQTGPLSGIANYDRGLSGSGMLLWLIDDQVVNANLAANTVNNSFLRPGVRLIEADGDNALQNTSDHDLGSAGDPFPGTTNNRAVTPLTTPSTLPYTQYDWVNIRNISEASMVVSFDAGFAPLPPQGVVLAGTTLSWLASTAPDIWQYAIYKNGVYLSVADTVSFVDDTAIDGDSFTVVALDASGNESAFSSAVVKQQPAATGGGGGCFIATAAYGSYLHADVKALRKFRDEYLLNNSAGRVFVNLYYRYSPPLADIIARHETLRATVRVALTPVVCSIKYPIILLSCIIAAAAIILTMRRRQSASEA